MQRNSMALHGHVAALTTGDYDVIFCRDYNRPAEISILREDVLFYVHNIAQRSKVRQLHPARPDQPWPGLTQPDRQTCAGPRHAKPNHPKASQSELYG